MTPEEIDKLPWQQVITLAILAGGKFWHATRYGETNLWYFGDFDEHRLHPVEEDNRHITKYGEEVGFKTRTEIARAYLKWFVTQRGNDDALQ